MDELKYERVEHDLYDIVDRIREIDPSYFVLRERKSGRLEVHSTAQRGSTHALTLPRKRLDARDVEYVRRTRSENAARLLKEMQRENARLEIAEALRATKNTEREYEKILSKL